MNTRSFHRNLLAAAMAAGFGVSTAMAGTPVVPDIAVAERVTLVAGDCYAIGQRIAAQNGGKLAAARAATKGGQSVCVIVVLVPGKNGQRPKRQEFVVPQ